MSIENLNGANFPFVINNILTKNIDSPAPGQTLSIGVDNADLIVIGDGGTIRFKGTVEANIIDADATVSSTLFISPNNALNTQIGVATGAAITVPPGIFTKSIDMGGSLGAGTLSLGGETNTTEVDIGQGSAPIKLFGGSLQFPTTLLSPLVITDSQASQTITIPFTGAIVNPAGAHLSFYKFGDWVTVDFKHLLVPQLPTVSGVALTCLNVLPINYRPLVSNRNFTILVADNGVTQAGQAFINVNGDLSMGNASAGTLSSVPPATNNIAVFDWSYTFNVNG